MKSLGKNMKIAFHTGKKPEEALRDFLSAYRAKPHVSTGIAPGDFMMRNGYNHGLVKVTVPDEMELEEARNKDEK